MTVCSGQTALNNICLTPEQYRFYAGAVIDKQTLVKDTTHLNGIINDLSFKTVSLESDLERCALINDKMGEKEAIYENTIGKLQDAVDKYKIKTVRNRRIAIVGFGFVTLEGLIIAGFVYFNH